MDYKKPKIEENEKSASVSANFSQPTGPKDDKSKPPKPSEGSVSFKKKK
jgi:hypothetical protein